MRIGPLFNGQIEFFANANLNFPDCIKKATITPLPTISDHCSVPFQTIICVDSLAPKQIFNHFTLGQEFILGDFNFRFRKI